MNQTLSTPVRHRLRSWRRKLARWWSALRTSEPFYAFGEAALSILVGLLLGLIVLYANGLDQRWKGLVILATIAPAVLLLVNNLGKLLLIAAAVDIVMGLDISLWERLEHKGGAPGFTLSLMTVLIVIGYARWVTNVAPDKKDAVQAHKDVTVPALAFLFFMILSILQAREKWFSYTRLFLETQYFLMYFYVANHIKNRSAARLILTTVVICLFFEGTLMIFQYATGFQLAALGIRSAAGESNITSAAARVGGTLISPNAAATYLAASLAITFAIALTNDRIVNKKLALVALLPGLPALITTQSRGGWTGFALAMLILIMGALKKRVGVRAITGFFIVIVILGVGFSTQIAERFTADDRDSAETRVWHAKLAFNILEDHMFTGIGLNNLWYVRKDYLPLELIDHKENILHNKYLTIWTETGLFGFLAFVWLMIAAARRAIKDALSTSDPNMAVVLVGLLAGLVVYMWHMTVDTFSGRPRMQFLWLILALIVALGRLAQKPEESAPASKEPV